MSLKMNTSQSALAKASSKTAIYRPKPSLPARTVIDSYLTLMGSVLDWGCGRGKDVLAYQSVGMTADGYDPSFRPGLPTRKYHLVTCTYVLNTLPPQERVQCLLDAVKCLHAGGYLFLAVRTSKDIEKEARGSRLWKKHMDGYITSWGTFQHGFTQNELDDLVRSVDMTGLVPLKVSGAVTSLSQKV